MQTAHPLGDGPFFAGTALPWGLVGLDRMQSEARSEEFVKAREAARLPDDSGGFRVCGEGVT
jgi:hypothetical protein